MKSYRARQILGILLAAFAVFQVTAAVLAAQGRVGVLDWDMYYFLRWLVPHSILQHHEAPWWNPWYCGGFTAWGLGEGDGNFISPFLPIYLLLPFDLAVRWEIVAYAIVGAWGTWLLAGRFLKDPVLKALLVAVAFLNGRWMIQLASGHLWHLTYAWVPWGAYFFDRALETGRYRWAAATGVCSALLVYTGGIYPGPHLALLLFILAARQGRLHRDWKPIRLLLFAGAFGAGLAAPRLLAVAEAMAKNSRYIGSPERTHPIQLLAEMLHPHQGLYDQPIRIAHWGWWEHGLFVGIVGVILVLLGISWKGPIRLDEKLRLYRFAGIAFLLLGFGNWRFFSPWFYLHLFPVFSSQHVPSRFHFVAVMTLAIIGAASLERLPLFKKHRGWITALAVIGILNIGWTGQRIWNGAFKYDLPQSIPFASEFSHSNGQPVKYVNQKPADFFRFPSLLANVGLVSPLNITDFASHRVIPRESPDYRGMAFLVGPTGAPAPGTAKIIHWTPNSALVDVHGAQPGSWLVYNMDLEKGWKAQGKPAEDWKGLVATRWEGGESGTVEFRYRPDTLRAGLAALVFTLLAAGAFGLARVRRPRIGTG